MEYDVEVDIRATVRVRAQSEDDAMDMADAHVDTGTNFQVHSVYPICATEV